MTDRDLKRFEVSPERGFLPEPDPDPELPARYAAWDELAFGLPALLVSGRVHSAIESLPRLEVGELPDGGPLRRAMLVLSFLGHAYVWGASEPRRELPATLAVPWAEVAERLGRPPVLSYASYALDNWRRLDPGGPIALDNLALLQNFLGGADEEWFILVHVEIELRASHALRALLPATSAAARGDEASLGRELALIEESLEQMAATLARMPEWCDPYVYYRRVRPFIHGWRDQPALPEGLVYDGVARFGGRPQRFRGETGAQSSIVPALDAALGVRHADDPLRTYLVEMRDYAPARHRAFVREVEAGASIRDCVAARSSSELREAYNACLRWLECFRAQHLEYAARYVQKQCPTGPENPTNLGTAGTPFIPYLRKHRDETARHRL